jgi:hypothetical protein
VDTETLEVLEVVRDRWIPEVIALEELLDDRITDVEHEYTRRKEAEAKLEAMERQFPMQNGPSIPWPLAEKIYVAYQAAFGSQQSLKRLAERGGFGWAEVEHIVTAAQKEQKMNEQVSHKSELRQRYEAECGATAPAGDSERPPYIPWLETKLEAVRLIMGQPWSDSHDRGCEEAFKRLARISNALDMNNDPVTEDTPSSD